MGSRKVPFSRELFIEHEDFMETPPSKFFRLAPGREVRLKNAYFIKCEQVVKNSQGNIAELHCTYDPDSRGGNSPDGRKVKGTLHWVSAPHAVDAEVRLYDQLYTVPNLDDIEEGIDPKTLLNPKSLEVLKGCKLEPGMADAAPGTGYQFLRMGYFCIDEFDSKPGSLVINRTATLKDSWAKEAAKG
jgi:glutaminyl-tRNA synthetase